MSALMVSQSTERGGRRSKTRLLESGRGGGRTLTVERKLADLPVGNTQILPRSQPITFLTCKNKFEATILEFGSV